MVGKTPWAGVVLEDPTRAENEEPTPSNLANRSQQISVREGLDRESTLGLGRVERHRGHIAHIDGSQTTQQSFKQQFIAEVACPHPGIDEHRCLGHGPITPLSESGNGTASTSIHRSGVLAPTATTRQTALLMRPILHTVSCRE